MSHNVILEQLENRRLMSAVAAMPLNAAPATTVSTDIPAPSSAPALTAPPIPTAPPAPTAAPTQTAARINSVPVAGGTELNVIARPNTKVKISLAAHGLAITSNGVRQVFQGVFTQINLSSKSGNNRLAIDSSVIAPAIIQGGSGNDTLVAGGGTETLYAGLGRDVLIGGTALDTLVAVNGGRDTLTGGTGVDSFWALNKDVVTNISPKENTLGAVHWIAQPVQPLQSGQTLNPAQTIPRTGSPSLAAPASTTPAADSEPAITDNGVSYASFAGDPLFSAAGPMPNDVVQGQLGDCYFLATLAAIARANPMQIRQDVVQLADGTFLTRFQSGGSSVYEHVDAMLPAYNSGQLAYAQLGAGNSLWVAVIEKAFAVFRYGANTYDDISAGWMSEVYGVLGLPSLTTYGQQEPNAAALMSLIQSDLASHQAVTVAVLEIDSNVPLIPDHAYSVDSVTMSGGIVTGVTLRNPWGITGVPGYTGFKTDNGYITISAAEAFDNIYAVTAGGI